MKWRSSGGAFVMLFGSLSLLAVAWQLVTTRVLEANSGCGFDGANYCQMFFGRSVPLPYQRLILAPWVASFLSPEPVTAFRILSTFCLVGIVLLVGGLIVTGKHRIDLASTATVIVSALAVVALNRNLLHLSLTYPVLTDYLALVLMLSGLLAALRMDRSVTAPVVALSSALLAPLARETMGFAFLGAAVVGFMTHSGKLRLRWAAIGAAALAGTFFAFQRGGSGSVSVLSVTWSWVLEDFTKWEGAARFACMLVIALGFFWLPLLRPAFRKLLAREEWVLLGAAAAYAAVSVFGGGDTDRILMPAGILLLIVAGRVTLRARHWVPSFLFLCVAFILAQAPFTIVGVTDNAWISFFALRVAPWSDFLANGAAPVLLALPFALASWFAMVEPIPIAEGSLSKRGVAI